MEYGRISRRSRTLGGVMVGKDTVPGMADVVVPHGRLLTLNTDPLVLVPAPGGPRLFLVYSRMLIGAQIVTPYGGGGNVDVHYTDAAGDAVSESISGTGSQGGDSAVLVPAKADQVEITLNAPLALCASAAFTGGSPENVIHIRMFYWTHSL